MTLIIGVHKMHGQVHPNLCHITDLLVVDLHSSLAYYMMTHPFPVAGKLLNAEGQSQIADALLWS